MIDDELSRILFESLGNEDIMMPSGSLNLASCYPANGVLQPNLGEQGDILSSQLICLDIGRPKNVCGHGELNSQVFFTLANADKQAKTHANLHMDHSDVVNLMFHSQATWHVFHARDAIMVEQYLKELNGKRWTENDHNFSELFSGYHFLTSQC